MAQRAHHIHLYKKLALSENATLDDLKHSYRLLALKYHPDKNTNRPEKNANTELFKQVHDAYQELKSFHENFGHLPLNPEFDPHLVNNHPQSTESFVKTHKPEFNSVIMFSIILIIIFLVLLLIPEQETTHHSVKTNPDQTRNSDNQNLHDQNNVNRPNLNIIPHNTKPNKHPIMLGMKMGKVFELLGVPDATAGENWYYGNSEIYFRDGHVAGWIIDPTYPIYTDMNLPSVQIPLPSQN